MTVNEDQGVCYMQPRTLEQRVTIARDFVERFEYELPLVVDLMDNGADEAYAGWPERLYVIAPSGRVVYKGAKGPFGFDPDGLETWLKGHLESTSVPPLDESATRTPPRGFASSHS